MSPVPVSEPPTRSPLLSRSVKPTRPDHLSGARTTAAAIRYAPLCGLHANAGILTSMPLYEDPAGGLRMAADPLEAWTAELIERLGTPPDVASDVAEVLLASDLRGIASHGTARLPQYVALAEAGVMDPRARPVRERGRPGIVLFDARNGWGHHAGRVAMDDAIERALTLGTAISVVRNSNHYGIAGWYAMRAAEGGLIGASMTNTSPLVAPTRARVSMLGTNPIAVA